MKRSILQRRDMTLVMNTRRGDSNERGEMKKMKGIYVKLDNFIWKKE